MEVPRNQDHRAFGGYVELGPSFSEAPCIIVYGSLDMLLLLETPGSQSHAMHANQPDPNPS